MQSSVSRPESPPTHAILTKEKVLTKPPNAPIRPRRADDYREVQYPYHLSLAWARLQQEHGQDSDSDDSDDDQVDDELVALSHIRPPTRAALLPRRKLFQDNDEHDDEDMNSNNINNSYDNDDDDDTRDPVVSPFLTTGNVLPQLQPSRESRERPPSGQPPPP